MATCLWLITNAVFGFGCGVLAVIAEGAGSGWIFLPATLASSIGTLPVLLVLTFAFSAIDDLPLGALDKTKRLLLTCYGCTLPYALAGAAIVTNDYNNPHYWRYYFGYLLCQSAVLFVSSIIGVLIINKTILNFFSGENEMPTD